MSKKKVYHLIIEYQENTDTIEYVKEEIVDQQESYMIGSVIVDDYFDEEILALLPEGYILGES